MFIKLWLYNASNLGFVVSGACAYSHTPYFSGATLMGILVVFSVVTPPHSLWIAQPSWPLVCIWKLVYTLNLKAGNKNGEDRGPSIHVG